MPRCLCFTYLFVEKPLGIHIKNRKAVQIKFALSFAHWASQANQLYTQVPIRINLQAHANAHAQCTPTHIHKPNYFYMAFSVISNSKYDLKRGLFEGVFECENTYKQFSFMFQCILCTRFLFFFLLFFFVEWTTINRCS